MNQEEGTTCFKLYYAATKSLTASFDPKKSYSLAKYSLSKILNSPQTTKSKDLPNSTKLWSSLQTIYSKTLITQPKLISNNYGFPATHPPSLNPWFYRSRIFLSLKLKNSTLPIISSSAFSSRNDSKSRDRSIFNRTNVFIYIQTYYLFAVFSPAFNLFTKLPSRSRSLKRLGKRYGHYHFKKTTLL